MEKPDYDKIEILEIELGYRDLEEAESTSSPVGELVATTYSRYNAYIQTMWGTTTPIELLIDEATRNAWDGEG